MRKFFCLGRLCTFLLAHLIFALTTVMDTDTLTTPSHFYELHKCSGKFMFIIDDCKPCYIKFNARITLKVILDDLSKVSSYCVGSRNKIDFQVNDSSHSKTETNSERHGSFALVEESDNNNSKENDYGFNSLKEVIRNPHYSIDMTDNIAERFDSFQSSEDVFVYDENNQTVKKECEYSDFDCDSSVTTCDLPKKESVFFPISDKIRLKGHKNKPETKEVRIEPQGLKTRVCRDNLRVKSKKVTKKRKTEKDDKRKQEIKYEIEPVQGNKESNSSSIEIISKGRKSRPQKLMAPHDMKCDYCLVTFSNKNDFYSHRRITGPGFECKICHKVEAFEAHLLVHMLSHEPNKGYVDEGNIGEQSRGKRVRQKIKCNVCGHICSSSLIRHMLVHTKESPYCCCVCKEAFSSLSSLQLHLESHKISKRIQCTECKEKFASRLELSEHKRTHEIKCGLCGEQFPNKTSRRSHYRTSHPNEIKRCSECRNVFSTDEELQKHILYHRANKKDQCPVCGLVVTKLKVHMAIHAKTTREKLFACDKCPMKYFRKSALTIHLRVHSGERPYSCNVCPKAFRCHRMLRKHLSTHSVERPFACELCGKKFTLRTYLMTHMRTHSESQKYPYPLSF